MPFGNYYSLTEESIFYKMQFLNAEILILMVTVLNGVKTELSFHGVHVCASWEDYQERITVRKTRPREIKIRKPCWNIMKFFSCEKTLQYWENYVDYELVPKKKKVPRCCKGYKEFADKCWPFCEWCKFGQCVKPDVCDCNSGYHGLQCSKECSEGFWGKNCTNVCECASGGICNKTVGCVCHPGWKGRRCEFPCEQGYYGHFCKNQCDCKDQDCNHITGECITTTVRTTEATTEFLMSATEASTTDKIFPIFTTTTDEFSATETTTHSVPESRTIADNSSSDTYRVKENSNNVETEATSSKNFTGKLNDNNTEKSTSWISHTASKEDADTQGIDNFISEGNVKFRQGIMFKLLHFLPSFSVISAISFLMVIIAARWVIVRHRRKTRMSVVEANIFQSNEQGVYQSENLFWVNNCTVNPVYMSDADLNNITPILETFKPTDKRMTSMERTVL